MRTKVMAVAALLLLGACDEYVRGVDEERLPDGLYDSTWTTTSACDVEVPDQVLIDTGNVSLWHVCPSGRLTFEAQANYELDGSALVVPRMPLYDCAGREAGAAASWRIEPGTTVDVTLSSSACVASYVVQLAAVRP